MVTVALTVAGSVVAAPPALDLSLTEAPKTSPGYLNEWLRSDDPYMAAWNLGVQYRIRYEVKEGAGAANAGAGADFSAKPGVNLDNHYLLQKTLIRAGYTGKWFEVFTQARDSSSTGDRRPTPGITTGAGPESDGPLDLHQAYLMVGNHKEFPVSLKVGRQELSYGEERIIGNFAWNNIGRVFDAAKVRWQNSWFAMDTFSSMVTLPEDNKFNGPNTHDYFSGTYITTKEIPKLWSEFYVLARNADSQASKVPVLSPQKVASARDIYTIGFRLHSNTNDWGNWDANLEAAGQFGRFVDPALVGNTNHLSASLDHQAYAVVSYLNYIWRDSAMTPKLGVEYSFGSGDNNPKDGHHGTFENLFPTNHKFYGYADYASLQNIQDLRLMSSIKPYARLTLMAEGHLFWLADTTDSFYTVAGARRGGINPTAGTAYGINPGYNSFVGTELDLIASWAASPFVTFEGGYSHFFHGDYLNQTFSKSGAQDADWFYVQMQTNF